MTSGPEGPGPESPPDAARTFDTNVEAGEVGDRALSGVFVVFSWTFVSLAVAFVGNVILAHLLTPRDFGVVAIGATVTLLAGALAEGGLGAGLLRRPERPTDAELRTLTGIQLTVTSALAVLIAALALPFGTTGGVVALMAVSLPLTSLITPSRVVFGRNLQFRSITAIDATGVLANYVCSIALVLAGLGVWGLASGSIARSLVGALTVPFLSGGRLYRPTFEALDVFRGIVGFGLRFQANWLVIVIREQTINVVTASIAGVSTLGLWALGNRLLILANALGDAVGRVMFPAMAHVLGERREVAPLLERAARLTATASAVLLAGFVASTPGMVPALFGEDWVDVVPLFPFACVGTMLLSAIAYPSIGYLFAADRPGAVVRASTVHGVVWIVVTACLLPFVGVASIGIGFAVGAAAECVLVAAAVKELSGARLGRLVVWPLVAGVLGGIPGWALAQSREDLVGGILGGAFASAVTLLVLVVVARKDVFDLSSLSVRMLGKLLGRTAEQSSTI